MPHGQVLPEPRLFSPGCLAESIKHVGFQLVMDGYPHSWIAGCFMANPSMDDLGYPYIPLFQETSIIDETSPENAIFQGSRQIMSFLCSLFCSAKRSMACQALLQHPSQNEILREAFGQRLTASQIYGTDSLPGERSC